MIDKKRELLSHINECIASLVEMSADAAKLEIHDNDQASRRLKQNIKDFEVKKLKPFKEKVLDIRQLINNKNPKNKNNESESEQSESATA